MRGTRATDVGMLSRLRQAVRGQVVRAVRFVARNRGRLPRWADRLIDWVRWRLPQSWVRSLTGRRTGRTNEWDPPGTHERPAVPDAAVRLFIGPANFAGQGWAWARAAERELPGVGATCFALQIDGGFGFHDDFSVSPAAYRRSGRWQREQFRYVADGFTHVIIEAGRPLFADLYRLDPFREADALRANGLAVAMLSHGSDSRIPSLHAEKFSWSPFRDRDWTEVDRLQRQAEQFVERLAEFEGLTFVSTPDLLEDLPFAKWCPVVVDIERWNSDELVLTRDRPVVVHAPSNSRIKGTAHADAEMMQLHQRGLIEYRRIERVSSAQMPSVYRDADIVLDQFRLGSYGVAACEAMASCRVVIGNITEEVRTRVYESTELELPVVQAEPGEIGDMVLRLLEDRESGRLAAAAGKAFVARVHSGAFSASVLSSFLVPGRRVTSSSSLKSADG